MPAQIYRQHLSQARRLAELNPRRPRQGDLRLAVSSAYYALFHFLIHEATRQVVGSRAELEPLRAMLARSFAHTDMLNAAKSYGSCHLPDKVTRHLGNIAPDIPNELQELANTFVYAQEQRHLADYDLSERFDKQSVLALIDRTEQAVANWHQVRGSYSAQAFLLSLLTWGRLKGG